MSSAPPHPISAWGEASAGIPTREQGSSWAAAAQVIVAPAGIPFPRPVGRFAGSTILCIAECSGFVCVGEDDITGEVSGCRSGSYSCFTEQGGRRATR